MFIKNKSFPLTQWKEKKGGPSTWTSPIDDCLVMLMLLLGGNDKKIKEGLGSQSLPRAVATGKERGGGGYFLSTGTNVRSPIVAVYN